MFLARNSIVYWFWDFPLENLDVKDKLQMWGFEELIFWSKFCFFLTFWGSFSQCNFTFFRRWLTMVADIFGQSPTINEIIYFDRSSTYIWLLLILA